MGKIILITGIVLTSLLVNGQGSKFFVGLEGITGFHDNYSRNYFGIIKQFTEYNIGLRFNYELAEKLSLFSGILFSRNEFKYSSYNDMVVGWPDILIYDSKANYLKVPLKIGYRLLKKDKLLLYPAFGFINGFLIGNNATSNYDAPDKNTDLDKFIFETQLSFEFEYIMKDHSYLTGKKSFLTIGPYLNYDLINKMNGKLMTPNAISYGFIFSIYYDINKINKFTNKPG